MAGLMDFLQSASNSAASNVSAPVDGLAWLLRKAGVPMPQNPMLGSDWMAEKGLTKPVAQSGASLMGETAGMLAPFLAAAKAPQIAKGLLQGAENLAAPQTLNKQAGKAFVYPQDKALATAQANAAKSLDKGGLGLPANNTPAQRAQAMGHDLDGFHGMPTPIKGRGFDASMVAKNDYGAIGQGVYIDPSQDASYANTIISLLGGKDGSNVMPVNVRSGSVFNARDLPAITSAERSKAVTDNLKNQGYDGVISEIGGKANEMVMFDPSRIRSRFAAFDPARRNEADILGKADPELLKLMAAGLLGYGGYSAMKE